jgi:hypothetical protein|tara:strand:+ start:39 stop:350 length:312 start_codon:yes stop_codon:yes gene_type:complete
MKIPKQHKKNTKEEREIIQNAFMDCRNFFLDKYEAQVKIMEKYFPSFAVDKTQIPCLLTMDIITESKSRMTEGEFLSYKAYVQDVLDGWRPPLGLQVIEGGKK